MSRILKTTTALGLLVAMGACGSSSSGGGDDPVSRSGLPFATDDIPSLIEGLTPGQALTVMVRTIQFDQPDLTETFLDEFEISFVPADGTDLDEGTGTLTFGDEDFAFVAGVADLGDGITATLSEELIGAASVLLSIEVNDPALEVTFDNSAGTDFKSYMVLGFETSPADMATLAETPGSTFYFGNFVGLGEITGADDNYEDVNLGGFVDIEVSFETAEVDGSLTIDSVLATTDNVSLLGRIGGSSVTFGLDDGTILDGNGFANSANVVDSGVSDSSIDGVFYGADAAELSGTASIDYTSAGGGTLVGVGGYIAPIDD